MYGIVSGNYQVPIRFKLLYLCYTSVIEANDTTQKDKTMTLAMVQAQAYVSKTAKFGIKAHTAKAICVEFPSNSIMYNTCRFEWMPLSQVFFLETVSGIYVIMPVWLAKKNNLDYTVTSDQEINQKVSEKKAAYVEIFKDGFLNTDAAIKVK